MSGQLKRAILQAVIAKSLKRTLGSTHFVRPKPSRPPGGRTVRSPREW